MRRSPLIASALLAAAAPLAAQDAADSPPPACPDGRIAVIFIDNHSIFDTTDPDLDPRLSWIYRTANALHVRTRESVIRRELLVRPGDCYDPALLEESERLLRAHDFLSHVDVYGIRQPNGDWHVIADTQDEWSTRLDLRVKLQDGLAFDGVRLREANLLGTGRAVELFYLVRDANRDYGVSYATRQLAGSRWDLFTTAGRTRAGLFARETVEYPFVGERGRWAARQAVRWQDRFFDYVVDDAGREMHLLLPVRDKGVDLSLVHRVGQPGRMTLFGAALSFVELAYPKGIAGIERTGDDYDDLAPPDPALVVPIATQMHALRDLRLLLLLGQRRVAWVQREGLDAMRGEQDVRLGSEIDVAVGRSLPGAGREQDLIASLGAYAAAEIGDLILAGRTRLDGRRDIGSAPGSRPWNDLLVDADLLAYWKPAGSTRHTLVLRAAATGGWETRTPFQLSLGGDLGVRGYDRGRFPGGRRVLFTLEDRVYFGWPFRDALDLGGTAFIDVGRVWPGDAPFGVDSGWRAAAGLGLRGAFPAGGRTTYRLDLALPLERRAGLRDLRVVISVGELLGLGAEDRRIRLGEIRQAGVAADLFHFPE